MPIVKLAAEVRKHKGERFRVLADDAAFPPDLEAWCNQSQMSIQSLTREGSLHIAEIQRIKEEPTEPPTPVPVAFDSGDDLSISQEQELFTEMQEMGFWDTELPTAPTRAIHVKKLISLDMRGHTDAQIRLELASQEVQEGMGFRLLIDATTPIDPVKEWSSMYRMEVATEKEGDQRVIWLQSPSSPN